MMTWNNFSSGNKPQLDLVVRVPQDVDVTSFSRGAEAAVAALCLQVGELESIQVHEPGPKTIELLKKRYAEDAHFEQVGASWYMALGDEEFQVLVLQFHFKENDRDLGALLSPEKTDGKDRSATKSHGAEGG